MEILVDEKNAEILRLYEQLKPRIVSYQKKDEQMRIKDRQIAEKTNNSISSNNWPFKPWRIKKILS